MPVASRCTNGACVNKTSIQMEARCWLASDECRILCDLAGIAYDALMQRCVLPRCPDFYASITPYLACLSEDETEAACVPS